MVDDDIQSSGAVSSGMVFGSPFYMLQNFSLYFEPGFVTGNAEVFCQPLLFTTTEMCRYGLVF